MSSKRAEREVGQTVREPFHTLLPGGALTDQFRHKTNGTGDPAFELRRRSTGAAVGTPPTIAINTTPGNHSMTWDSTGADANDDYDLYCTDGEINDGTQWVDVSGQNILHFPLLNSAAGFVLERSVKVLAGTVVSVASTSQMVCSVVGVDHTGQPDDHYANMRLVFQSGLNNGIGKDILTSTPSGTDIDLILARPLVSSPAPGDVIKIIPEEQPGPAAIAHATIDFVLPDNRYACVWTFDNAIIVPDGVTTIDVWNLTTGAVIAAGQSMQAAQGSSWTYTTSTTVPAGEQVQARFTAQIRGKVYSWPEIRTNLVTVQGT